MVTFLGIDQRTQRNTNTLRCHQKLRTVWCVSSLSENMKLANEREKGGVSGGEVYPQVLCFPVGDLVSDSGAVRSYASPTHTSHTNMRSSSV